MNATIPSLTGAMLFFALGFFAVEASAAKADAEAGKVKYQQFCASCHGKEGKGDGLAAAALTPKPRDHTNAEYMNKLKDEDIFRITKLGGPAVKLSPHMPPWGGALSDQDIRNIVAYIRTLARPKEK